MRASQPHNLHGLEEVSSTTGRSPTISSTQKKIMSMMRRRVILAERDIPIVIGDEAVIDISGGRVTPLVLCRGIRGLSHWMALATEPRHGCMRECGFIYRGDVGYRVLASWPILL